MRNFLSLCKVQILSVLGLNKIFYSKKKDGRKLFNVLALCLGIFVALVAVLYLYLDIYARTFIQSGLIHLFVPFLLCLIVLVTFILSFYSIGSLIYGFKDYDLLSSMPIKKPSIIASKLVVSYLLNLFFSLIVMFVGVVVLVKLGVVFELWYLLRIIVLSIFCPILTLSLSLIVCAFIYYAASRTKRKSLIHTILILLFFIVYFGLSFIIDHSFGIFYIIGPLAYALEYLVYILNNWLWTAILIVSILALCSIVILALSCTYEKMHDLLTSVNVKRDFVLKNYSQTSLIKSLYKKENKLLTAYPVYLSNTILSSVLAVVSLVGVGVFVLVADKTLVYSILPFICYFAPIVICFTCFISPTTMASISIEGDSFYIVKCAPIKACTLLLSKFLIHLSYNTVPIAIAGIFFGVCILDVGVVNVLLIYLCLLVVSSQSGLLGLIYNLNFPMMKWDNANKPVKQSLASFLMVITTIALSGLLVVFCLYSGLAPTIYLIVITAFFLICNVISLIYLKRNGAKLLEEKT